MLVNRMKNSEAINESSYYLIGIIFNTFCMRYAKIPANIAKIISFGNGGIIQSHASLYVKPSGALAHNL